MEHRYSVSQSGDVWFVEEENTLPPWLMHIVYCSKSKEEAERKREEYQKKDLVSCLDKYNYI